MASLKVNAKEKHQSNIGHFIVHSTTSGLIVHRQNFIHRCAHCKSTNDFSSFENTNDGINNSINEFQKSQWNKYGQIMPTNWIDPFEIYD